MRIPFTSFARPRAPRAKAPVPDRRRAAKGFTLVELMVGAALSAAVMAAVLSSYIYLGRGLNRLANQQTLETETRRTLAYFTQDVQSATGLTSTISATRVSLVVPSATGTNTVTYYYNNSSSSTSVSINGTSVTMAADALTRCVYDGSTVTPQTLLRNISTGGLTFSYYDGAGNAYASYTNYIAGIKQLSLQVTTQAGSANNGTQTRPYQAASSRLVLRNRAYLQ